MKKCKGLAVSMLVTILLVGSLTWGNISNNQGDNLDNGGEFGILQDDNPIEL